MCILWIQNLPNNDMGKHLMILYFEISYQNCPALRKLYWHLPSNSNDDLLYESNWKKKRVTAMELTSALRLKSKLGSNLKRISIFQARIKILFIAESVGAAQEGNNTVICLKKKEALKFL